MSGAPGVARPLGGRCIVHADAKLSAFVELERQVLTGGLLPLFRIFLSII